MNLTDVLTKVMGYWLAADNVGVQAQAYASGYIGFMAFVSCTTGSTEKGVWYFYTHGS